MSIKKQPNQGLAEKYCLSNRIADARERIEAGRSSPEGWIAFQLGMAYAEAARGRLPQNLEMLDEILSEVGV